jgi:hypothetical protein
MHTLIMISMVFAFSHCSFLSEIRTLKVEHYGIVALFFFTKVKEPLSNDMIGFIKTFFNIHMVEHNYVYELLTSIDKIFIVKNNH